MPNLSENDLIISGKQSELDRLEEFIRTDKLLFSLERIIPIPPDSPVDWRSDNWGTDREVIDSRVIKDDSKLSYFLLTAWYTPANAVVQLFKEFPTLHFALEYWQVNDGVKGRFIIEDGSVIGESDETEFDVDEALADGS